MPLSLVQASIPDDVVFDVLNRDAALWLGDGALAASAVEQLASLIKLPWRNVFVESTSPDLAATLRKEEEIDLELARRRGYLHVIASDPSRIPLPPRCLPVYFLNGIASAADRTESSSLAALPAQRRRLNMVAALQESGVKRVVFIGHSAESALSELQALWLADFRCFASIVTEPNEQLPQLPANLGELRSLSFVQSGASEAIRELSSRTASHLSESRLFVRVREPSGALREFDFTDAELLEQPVLDHYELILSRDLRLISPHDLSKGDLDNFFSQDQPSWRPYAAGLPWERDGASKKVLQLLKTLYRDGAEASRPCYIVSEPGAGGTTLARSIAFAAAQEGFPTLVARDHFYDPSATELVSFVNRTLFGRGLIAEDRELQSPPVPWLLVFDKVHWDGQESAIAAFLADIRRSGRSVLVVKVVDDELPQGLPDGIHLTYVTHTLELDEAARLGAHLNKFLKVFNRQKTESDWTRFWEDHRPDVDVPIAAFWVALEFWLRGLIELGESVQSWLLRHFKQTEMPDDLRVVVLQIAALTIERRAVPELLLPRLECNLPLSLVLEELRQAIPALALIKQSTPTGRHWALAHDVLGRYLITGAYYDRLMMKQLGFDKAQTPAELRLQLIGGLTRQGEIGSPQFLPYAIQFAVKTLKLDESGNPEFYQHWRMVLKLLEDFPKSVWRSSRAFNHHVAISRRRVARSDQFEKSEQEQVEQLKKAVKEIEYAVRELTERSDDETNLNLYNSLALAYQDLAEVALAQGADQREVIYYRTQASEAIYAALRENPSNSYTLETAAKDLLQRAKLEVDSKVASAAEALGYIFQATSLDTASGRQVKLDRLAQGALAMLRGEGADKAIADLKAARNPMGYLAEAWLALASQGVELGVTASVTRTAAAAAFDLLASAPRHWLVVRLQYELLCRASPTDFTQQLDLLDELNGTAGYRPSLQLRLERAILLHLKGRHGDANAAYKRLRQDTFEKRTEIISVPERLRWFTTSDGASRILCHAKVADNFRYRPLAKVGELAGAPVPFIAQDFGVESMAPGMSFRCHITFGPMGPFIKPPQPGK